MISSNQIARPLDDLGIRPLTWEGRMSEGGLEPFAYAQVLSAEFAREPVMTGAGGHVDQAEDDWVRGLPKGYRSGSSRSPSSRRSGRLPARW
jgi:hypothetical protein